MSRIIAIIFGAVSCVAAAFLNFYIQELTTINIFSLSMFFVIPVGAGLVGFAANSGYYLSALMTDRMLDKYDFLIMVGIAAIGMFLIYGIEYYFYVERVGLSTDITFWQYITFVVKNSILKVKLTKFSTFNNVGSMGNFGYLFLLIHLVGFVIGGVTAFFLLLSMDICPNCSKYLRNKKKKILFFSTKEGFENYYNQVNELKPTSHNFKSTVFINNNIKFDKTQGSIKCVWRLKKCNVCNFEQLNGNAEIYQGKDWSTIQDAEKKIIMPIYSNLDKQWNT